MVTVVKELMNNNKVYIGQRLRLSFLDPFSTTASCTSLKAQLFLPDAPIGGILFVGLHGSDFLLMGNNLPAGLKLDAAAGKSPAHWWRRGI